MKYTYGMSAVVASAVLVLSHPAQGQEESIPDMPTCSACEVRFEHLARLGSPHGDGFIEADLLSVSSMANGDILLLPARNGSGLIFRRDGEFVRRLGQEGQGPGEYIRPSLALALSDGRTAVFDLGQGRVSFLDQDHRFVSVVPSTANVVDAMQLEDGAVVVNAFVPTPDKFGIPLHVLDIERGTIRESFGEAREEAITNPNVIRRALIGGRGTQLWTVRATEYVLELFGDDRERLRTLRRTPPWFPGESAIEFGRPGTPPSPFIRDARMDARGLIWIAAWVPTSGWAQAWHGLDVPPEGEFQQRPSYNELYSTRIELIDPDTGLLVSQLWRELILEWIDEDVVATTFQDILGVVYVDLWRVRLSGLP